MKPAKKAKTTTIISTKRVISRPNKSKLTKLLKRPEVESWRTLMGTFQTVYRALEQALLREQCSISRFQILFLIYFYGPLSASDIAQKLCVTRGNISTFLNRLEADHLTISLPTGERGGRELVELTGKGARFFEKILPPHIERVTKLMPRLSPDFLTTLRAVTVKLQ